MAIDWNGRLETAHGRKAVLLPPDGAFAGRRVSILGDWAAEREVDWPTTWHYADDGTLPSAGPEWTLRNAA